MEHQQYKQIINSAIKKEEEAIVFYKMLKTMIPFKGKEELISELINMEKGHIIVLENLCSKKEQIHNLAKIENLGIADYLKIEQSYEEMDYKAILELAMKKEDKAEKFYMKMADLFEDDDIKAVFLKLANEEAKHKNYFEKIYDDEILKEN